ncbi:UNVERIFIED_ORG: hypothetical protein ABIC54_005962 [Burkholderia sp. 1263]
MTQDELNVLLGFWTRVGQAMNIPNLPRSLVAWKASQRDYEARYMSFTAEGERLAALCLREVVRLSLPFGTRWFFRLIMTATLDPVVRKSLGVADPPWYTTVPVRTVLCVLAWPHRER